MEHTARTAHSAPSPPVPALRQCASSALERRFENVSEVGGNNIPRLPKFPKFPKFSENQILLFSKGLPDLWIYPVGSRIYPVIENTFFKKSTTIADLPCNLNMDLPCKILF